MRLRSSEFRPLAVVLWFALLAAPGARAASPFAFVPARAVLLQGDGAEKVAAECGFKRAQGDKLIDIEDGELLGLASRLPDYLATVSQAAADALPSQYFQIAGFISRGKRVICLNAFAGERPDWRKRAVRVEGGGARHWRLAYDVKTARFSRFAVNADE